jgi:hypothetical protein
VLLLLGLLLCAAAAGAGELIRYRTADGSVGFAGSASAIPPGATILTRRPSTALPDATGPKAPSVESMVSGVRRHCQQGFAHDVDELEYCIAEQTQAALRLRDLLLEQRKGSEAERITNECRRQADRRAPNYRRLLGCAEAKHSEFRARTGLHPASLDARSAKGEGERRRQHGAKRDRLQQLRDDQERASRALAIGRNVWRPRYRRAERKLHDAETKTRSIVERMKQRGCRTDSLACGGLSPKLEAARLDEANKREYLSYGLVEECRQAGCQPGWLR